MTPSVSSIAGRVIYRYQNAALVDFALPPHQDTFVLLNQHSIPPILFMNDPSYNLAAKHTDDHIIIMSDYRCRKIADLPGPNFIGSMCGASFWFMMLDWLRFFARY
jgi:hypothetical protein